jgi:hypothetical protein
VQHLASQLAEPIAGVVDQFIPSGCITGLQPLAPTLELAGGRVVSYRNSWTLEKNFTAKKHFFSNASQVCATDELRGRADSAAILAEY